MALSFTLTQGAKQFGESTNLTGDDNQGYNWSVSFAGDCHVFSPYFVTCNIGSQNPEPVKDKKNVIQAHNETSKVQDISFCT